MPQRGKLSAGLESYTILKRDLEDEYGSVRSLQNSVLLSYGIFDWLSLDLKAGTGYIKHHPLGSSEIDYPTSFAAGYGLRLKLYEKDSIKVISAFQHISVHPRKALINNLTHRAILDDWQVSVLASYDFGMVIPYLGTRWSRIDYIHKIEEDRKRKMSDLTKSTGFIFGFALPFAEKAWLNLEGQFFDSKAFAVSVNYAF